MRRAPVDIAALFDRVAERHERELRHRGIELVRHVGSGAELATGDADRLEQALQNLAANALRHTPDGGTIRLTAEPDRGRRAHHGPRLRPRHRGRAPAADLRSVLQGGRCRARQPAAAASACRSSRPSSNATAARSSPTTTTARCSRSCCPGERFGLRSTAQPADRLGFVEPNLQVGLMSDRIGFRRGRPSGRPDVPAAAGPTSVGGAFRP